MKTNPVVLAIMAYMLVPAMVFGMEVSVDVSGSQELSSQKAAIEKTTIARCVAKGVALERYSRLSVTISTLGGVVSFDALLDSTPPRAFHKDMKDISTLSATIDEMIASIFSSQAAPQATQPPTAGPETVRQASRKVKLEFVATSIAAAGDRLFASDSKTVYSLNGEKAAPVWKAPGNNEILRMYPYGDSIIVLTKNMNVFRSFWIQGAEVKERWDSAVIPLGEGLVSTQIRFDMIYGIPPYSWSKAKPLKGSSPQIPGGLDILSTRYSDITAASPGPEFVSYSNDNSLVVSDGKMVVWKENVDAGISSQYIDDEDLSRGANDEQYEPSARYALKPRVVILGDRMITYRNDQGMGKMVSRANMFVGAQVLVFTPSDKTYDKEVLAEFAGGYCPDITALQKEIAVLVVSGKTTYVQFFGL